MVFRRSTAALTVALLGASFAGCAVKPNLAGADSFFRMP